MAFPVVILGSGRGSNAEALLKAERSNSLGKASVAAIASDRGDAGILELGNRYDVPALHIEAGPGRHKLKGEAEQAYIDRIGAFSPKLIVLAGFMRIVGPKLIEAFRGRVINLHPSLLPSFPGLEAIGQAYRHGVKITGCTVHWVTPELDAGPILEQEPVRIEDDDTEETLAGKVHAAEHRVLPDVVKRLGEGAWDAPRPAPATGRSD